MHMTSRCLRWIHLGLCGLLAAGLSACAGLAPPPLATPLLDDAAFGHPPRPAEADGVMALDEAMRRFLRERLADAVREKGRPRALAEALYARGELKLDYDNAVTRNAAQAFAARSGNCLSLVLMTAAMAHELGVDVRYQDVSRVESYSRSGGLTLQAGHINLVLAPRDARGRQETLRYESAGDAVQIDFLPPQQLRGLRSEPISEQRVLAMFMNNRAVEALQRGEGPAAAYAWVREALRLDAGFWPAINSLGVIYQRAGQAALAAAAFERVLVLDTDNLPALGNLPPALVALGRLEDAERWTARRLALQPHSPFHHLALAEAALDRSDLAAARQHLADEQAVTGDSHELFLQQARLQLAMGREGPARAALQAAIDHRETPPQRQRYAAKLEQLRALAAH
jgi:Tfp pilus assembly protein PilF